MSYLISPSATCYLKLNNHSPNYSLPSVTSLSILPLSSPRQRPVNFPFPIVLRRPFNSVYNLKLNHLRNNHLPLIIVLFVYPPPLVASSASTRLSLSYCTPSLQLLTNSNLAIIYPTVIYVLSPGSPVSSLVPSPNDHSPLPFPLYFVVP